MPYDQNSQTPAYIQKLSSKNQRRWRHIWNSAYSSCMNGAEPDSGRCESKAFAEASGVVMHSADFKTLSSDARESIPSDKFAYTDPQGGKHLPIHDLAHLRNAIARLGQPKTLAKWMSAKAKKALQARLQAKLGSTEGKAVHAMAEPAIDFKKMSRDDFLAMIAAKKNGKKGKKNKSNDDDEDDKKVKVKGKADHSMVDFALNIAETKFVGKKDREKAVVKDGLVYRNGLIFRAGEYPDKQFSLSPVELRKAAEEFSDPLDIDLEHVPTPLDGKLGQLVAVESNSDGTELHGVVAIPKWLDAILPKHKVSASWDRAKKTLAGLALVRHPRVSDAALMAAFAVEEVLQGKATNEDLIAMSGYDGMDATGGELSQSAHDQPSTDTVDHNADTPDGKIPPRSAHGLKALQKIHDITAGRGAVCKAEPMPGTRNEHGIVKYSTASEVAALQGIHDMTLTHGASCSMLDLSGTARSMPGRWTWEYPGVGNDGRKGQPGDTKASHFAETEQVPGGDNLKGGNNVGSKLDRVMAALEEDESESPAAAKVVKSEFSEELRVADEERARLREENRKLRLQGIMERAVNFADKLVTEGRAVPSERDPIISMHVQLGTDDGFVGTASFSDGGSRVSLFEAIFAARPKHMMDAEAAPKAINELVAFANSMRTVPTKPGDGPMSAERRRQLLGLDSVGKQVLKDEDRNGSTRR